jgi:hypothetical protein
MPRGYTSSPLGEVTFRERANGPLLFISLLALFVWWAITTRYDQLTPHERQHLWRPEPGGPPLLIAIGKGLHLSGS